MHRISKPSLHFKKGKGNHIQKIDQLEEPQFHIRSMSTSSASSTISEASSTRSNIKAHHSYDPLSLHPPLRFNASPVLPGFENASRHHDGSGNVPRLLGVGEEEEQQHATPKAADLYYYYNQDNRRRTYVYDQTVQWPLKDWQAVPPGLANMDEKEFNAQSTPRRLPYEQRRPLPKDNLSSIDMFVQRGEWKRRGIVFGPGYEEEDDHQDEHFELPEPEPEPHFEFF